MLSKIAIERSLKWIVASRTWLGAAFSHVTDVVDLNAAARRKAAASTFETSPYIVVGFLSPLPAPAEESESCEIIESVLFLTLRKLLRVVCRIQFRVKQTDDQKKMPLKDLRAEVAQKDEEKSEREEQAVYDDSEWEHMGAPIDEKGMSTCPTFFRSVGRSIPSLGKAWELTMR